MSEETRHNVQPIRTPTRLERLMEKCKVSGPVKFFLIVFSAAHIAQIVIAALYYKQCPVETQLPVHVLIMGILGIVTKLLSLFHDFLIRYMKVNPILSFITPAEIAMFIVGSYYVYGEYEPNYDPQSGDKYCNKTLYLFSFIYITIIYCLILLSILIVGGFVLGLVLLDKYGPKEDRHDEGKTTEIPLTS